MHRSSSLRSSLHRQMKKWQSSLWNPVAHPYPPIPGQVKEQVFAVQPWCEFPQSLAAGTEAAATAGGISRAKWLGFK